MVFDQYFKPGLTSCRGVELKLNTDGMVDMRSVELFRKGKLVHLGNKKQGNGALDEVLKNLSGPVALAITGRGVLVKKTRKLEEVTEGSLQHVFPGFKLEDFYVQNFVSGDDSYLSVIRKETADKLIAGFRKNGIAVLMLGLGPFAVDQVIPQLNIYEGTLGFDGHLIRLKEDQAWESYGQKGDEGTGFSLKIDMEVIPEQFLIAYAIGFQLLLTELLEPIEVDGPLIQTERTEVLAKLRFEKRGMMALASVFVLLLINFLLFSYYDSHNQEMAGRAGRQSDQMANRKKMEIEIKEKELLVNKLGWNKGLKYAFICDQIASVLPAAVTLTELSVNEKEPDMGGAAKTQPREAGQIKIKGQADNVYAVNDCIYAFKKKSWIKEVQLEKYAADEQKQAQVFTIVLNY